MSDLKKILLGTAVSGLLAAGAAPASAGNLLYVATSIYKGTASTVQMGQPLPISPTVDAIADGSFPGVFENDTVDGNFGVTAPIYLNTIALGFHDGALVPTKSLGNINVTQLTGVVSSFSSKSELSIHLANDGTALTLMGYKAPVNALDVSNANTPDDIDPNNTDIQTPTYRAVVEIDLGVNGRPVTAFATPVDSYSGNNGRGAVLADDVNGSGQNEYLMAGNAGNSKGTPLSSIVGDTGAQAIAQGSASPVSTVIGVQQGTPGDKDGFQYGFSVTELGDAADKSGKDDNFRGVTVFNNTMYVTKGSGGNGVNTVYEVVTPTGGLPTAADAAQDQVSILPGLPTNLAANIVEGDPSTEFYPFDVWFANANTMYVADEGSQDLTADSNAGLQKWIYNGSKWVLAYVLQRGLNLDQTYAVKNYPVADYPATTGLRHITGYVHGDTVTIFATTATYSNMGDPGGDPNALVEIVDNLNGTSLPSTEQFKLIGKPVARNVYRGVQLVSTGN